MSSAASSSSLPPHKALLIKHAMSVDALKFGSFTLKSGRQSPYFFNAGLLCTGPILATLSAAYAQTIVDGLKGYEESNGSESEASSTSSSSLQAGSLPPFDVLFGPAYKGIPFASTAALALFNQHSISVGFAYDRKEAKDHGEGGSLVGVAVKGKKVVILDDVMTSGKAIRGAIDKVVEAGGQVVGVVQALDREEVGGAGTSVSGEGRSTVQEIEDIVGKGRVVSILKMRDLMQWLEEQGYKGELEKMQEYRDKYGVKN